MTPKEALEILVKQANERKLSNKIVANGIAVGLLENALNELERLKKFKETFDNYELVKKQDFIAYENWLECEKELEELKQEVIARQETENSLTQWVADLTTELTELKRDVKRFMKLDYQAKVGDFLDNVETNEYTRLHRKLNK